MLRLAFDFIITWRETRTRPNAYEIYTSFIFHTYNNPLIFNHPQSVPIPSLNI